MSRTRVPGVQPIDSRSDEVVPTHSYLRRIECQGDPGNKWPAFVRNHREAIVALDFFTVPRAMFQVLYSFFVIEHGRRRILHFNVTRHPSADWVLQQLREFFAEAARIATRFWIETRSSAKTVVAFLKAIGLKPKRTSVRSPWAKRDRRKMDRKLPPAKFSIMSSR
jgi:hypothetical protein